MRQGGSVAAELCLQEQLGAGLHVCQVHLIHAAGFPVAVSCSLASKVACVQSAHQRECSVLC